MVLVSTLGIVNLLNLTAHAHAFARCPGATQKNFKMLREIAQQFPEGLVILAFPTRDFLMQEFSEPHKVKDFAQKHGPAGMIVLMTKSLASRPGWWIKSEPSWNFKGKWLVSPSGERALADDPFAAVAAAMEAL